jgi:hypothetical protein
MLSPIALMHGVDKARRLAESAVPGARTVYETRRRREDR